MAREIFRKTALQKLSSPDQLDSLVKQVSLKGWLALLTFGLLILLVLIWGFYGSITTKVNGSGLIMKLSGMANIYSTTSGMISEIYIGVGSEVTKGEVVVKVIHKESQIEIKSKENALLILQEKYKELSQKGENDLKLDFSIFKKSKDEIKLQIKVVKKQRTNIIQKMNAQQELYDKGLIRKEELSNTKINLEKIDLEIINLHNSLSVKNIEAFQKKRSLENKLSLFEQKLVDATRNLRRLKQKLVIKSNIKSNFTGKIVELNAARGTVISNGSSIAVMENAQKNAKMQNSLKAVFFIPAIKGKMVQNGMTAQVSPSYIIKEEFGFIEADVDFVSEFPASSDAIMNIIKNKDLVQSFLKDGSPIIVFATLKKDTKTFSKLKWSSSKGPKVYITSGTVCSVQVAVRKQRPISFVIPYLKEKIGL